MADVASPSRFAGLGETVRSAPGTCLAVVLALHVVIWTALPALLSHNLQLDLVEDLALGREWQLGYWKHPPLPWWLADLAYRLTGDIHAVYLLGPLSAAACMWIVWLLGPRHRRRFPVADRRAGARRHPLLQFLGAEIRARPDAASVLGDDRPVPLSRHHRRDARATGCSRAPRSRCASGRNTPPSRSPAASACSCCSIRSRGARCARPALG